MIARITARHRECAFAGSRTRLLGILTSRPASQLEHSPSRIRQPQASRVELLQKPAESNRRKFASIRALGSRGQNLCSFARGLRTIRDPGHSARRPPSLSASLCRAPPPLSSSSGTESLPAPPKDASFSFLFCFLFYLFALSAFACCSEVTVTSVSLPPFVSRLFNAYRAQLGRLGGSRWGWVLGRV